MLKIVVISDVHCKFDKLVIPECDILISCGDYSFRGSVADNTNFHRWLDKQDARYVISVQGNHELDVEKNFNIHKSIAEAECPNVYFIDEGRIEIEGLKIWCSAVTPFFHNWAWNRHRGPGIKKHWDKIPDDTQLLVTHGPPKNILDTCPDGYNAGCHDLLDRIKQLKDLKFHLFGHIHGGYSTKILDGVTYINASICDENYQPTNKPICFTIDTDI